MLALHSLVSQSLFSSEKNIKLETSIKIEKIQHTGDTESLDRWVGMGVRDIFKSRRL